MTDIVTNPYNLEFRDGRGGRLVIYADRSIARIAPDGTLMAHATEIARSAQPLDSLGLAKAMFLVESESQLEAVVEWEGLLHFTKLTLNLYFVPDHGWLLEQLRCLALHVQHMEALEVTGAVPLPPLMGDEASKLFENIPTVRIMGY